MKCKILYSKKALSIDEAVPFVIFILICLFGIFFFSINERVKAVSLTADIQVQKDFLSGHELLINYLKQSDQNGNNKQDFISKLIINKKYEDLKNDLNEFFGKNPIHSNWQIEVKDNSKKLLIEVNNIAYSAIEQHSTHQTYSVGSVVVPIQNLEHNYITIELFFSR